MSTLILPNEFLNTILSTLIVLIVLAGIFYIKDERKLRFKTAMTGSVIILLVCFIPKAINEKSMINYHRERLLNLLVTKGVPTDGEIDIEIQGDAILFHIQSDSSTYSFPIKKRINQYVIETGRCEKINLKN